MCSNFFDFNNDGNLDPFETLIAAELVGSFGFGAGLSAAEEEAYYREEEYKERLSRKQRRIEDLEDELDSYHDSHDDDFDDDDDEDDYSEDEGYDDDDDDGYTSFVPDPPMSDEVLKEIEDMKKESAKKRRRILSTMKKGFCTNCIFWKPDSKVIRRYACCRIFDWVDFEFPEAFDGDPRIDRRVCPKYQEGIDYLPNCYDCKHWQESDSIQKRRHGCTKWSEVCEIITNIRNGKKERSGIQTYIGQFKSEWPFVDNLICADFELNNEEEPGYGQKKAQRLRVDALLEHLSTQGTYVAGIGHDNNRQPWIIALNSTKITINVKRDPKNTHDQNAIKVLVNGRKAGFIPAKIALILAPLMDEGYKVKVIDYMIETRPHPKFHTITEASAQIILSITEPK